MDVESTAQSSSLPTRLALWRNRSILFCSVMDCATRVTAVLVSLRSEGAFTSRCHCDRWL